MGSEWERVEQADLVTWKRTSNSRCLSIIEEVQLSLQEQLDLVLDKRYLGALCFWAFTAPDWESSFYHQLLVLLWKYLRLLQDVRDFQFQFQVLSLRPQKSTSGSWLFVLQWDRPLAILRCYGAFRSFNINTVPLCSISVWTINTQPAWRLRKPTCSHQWGALDRTCCWALQ